MKPKPFYISTPIATSVDDRCTVRYELDQIVDHMDLYDFSSTVWEVGTKYSRKDLEDAEVMIVILPDLAWKEESLTLGVRKEITYCIENKKEVILAYRRKTDGKILFYEVQIVKEPYKMAEGIIGIEGTFQSAENKLVTTYQLWKESSNCKPTIHHHNVDDLVGLPVKQDSWFW